MKVVEQKELFIFDLDGVIYRGSEPIAEAVEFISKLHQMNKKCTYLTNNSSKTRQEFAKKLQKLGLDVKENEIFTSAYLSADILAKKYPSATVFLIGETGLHKVMKERGFVILNEKYPELINLEILPSDIYADFVLVGWDRFVTYNKFRCAMMLIQKGAEFYATNADSSFPGPDALWPGAGALVAFLQTALHSPPKKIFGKPDPAGIKFILNQLEIHPSKAVMIGDRLSTDILAGNHAQITTIAVETGIHTKADLCRYSPEYHPQIFVSSLLDLFS
ncbi:MAG: HAD-IIA family hydrolase [Candidatus Lokiarchaeota archaeon]|nr:HAD-IIA family hydrolase [Candidatus Harpocratesius repetitus]